MLHHFHLDRLTAHATLNKQGFKSLRPRAATPSPALEAGTTQTTPEKEIQAQTMGTVDHRVGGWTK